MDRKHTSLIRVVLLFGIIPVMCVVLLGESKSVELSSINPEGIAKSFIVILFSIWSLFSVIRHESLEKFVAFYMFLLFLFW